MTIQLEAHERPHTSVEQFETIIVGGGQAGLAVGYHLARLSRPFVILDAHARVGDAWRTRWDSMRLFTPARRDGLPGMKFPGRGHAFPTGEAMGDYLEAYAQRFELPVRSGVRVDALGRAPGGRFLLAAGERRFEADNVVVATGPFQAPYTPPFAGELDPRIRRLHSAEYRNPGQLRDGPVLVVGAGNSGADLALELAQDRHVYLSGTLATPIPIHIEGLSGRLLFPVIWFVWSHVLTMRTPIGRRALPKIKAGREPLIRVKPKQLAAAGVERVPRTVGTRDGLPLLEDGRVLDVAGVVWCTGYRPAQDWIDLPVLDESADLASDIRGAVASEPGLYRVGREFLYAFNSHTVGGVGRDARRIAEQIAA